MLQNSLKLKSHFSYLLFHSLILLFFSFQVCDVDDLHTSLGMEEGRLGILLKMVVEGLSGLVLMMGMKDSLG